jgi:hypothetical protein
LSGKVIKSIISLVATTAAICLAAPASAEGPEQLDQLEPGNGEWQVEYNGQFGSTAAFERLHSVEAFYGVSEALAVGIEAEAEAVAGELRFGEASLVGLFRIADANSAPLGAGLMLAAGLDDDGGLAEAEARLILEKQTERWWGQANIMLRHANEDAESGELLAYGWNLSHVIADGIWIGVEGSGQAARLGGFGAGFDAAHFAGPAFACELEPSQDSEVEIGLAWLFRLGDEGPRQTARLSVQFSF